VGAWYARERQIREAYVLQMTKIICAIDPGIHGAFAWATDGFLIAVEDMPTIEYNGKHKISAASVGRMLVNRMPELLVIESVSAMPKQGVTSSFNFGYGAGVLEGVAAGLGIPVEMVRPATWKKAAGVSADKSACRLMATRYWPGMADLFKRVKDDGRADAALLARWASMRGK